MHDFIAFCMTVLKEFVSMFFNLDIGGYTYGDFLVVTLLVSVFVSSLALRFGSAVSSPPAGGHSGDDKPNE